jgi:nucleoside-diphosphate-sugar epimerase
MPKRWPPGLDSRPICAFQAWEEWLKTVSEEEAQATWDHIAHSPNCSIAKAQRLLHYQPRYTSLQAVQEAVTWLIEQGIVQYRSGVGSLARP